MSPRPRTVSDAEILTAAWTVMARLGPATVTLADVAQEIGLSPATLVQRFGSKRGLHLALAKVGLEGVDACFAAVRAAHPDPLDALVAAATEMTRHVKSPEELANHLAFLQIDLSDKDFHRVSLENSRRILAGYEALIDEAVAAGELSPCDAKALARAVGAIAGGSLIAWAIHREGTAESWVRADIDTLLASYRPTKKPEAAVVRRRAGKRRRGSPRR